MIRAKLWFTCAAMHDPVTPIIVKPSVLGWKAKKRGVEPVSYTHLTLPTSDLV